MAHNLDTRANGSASFVSLRQSAWHQLGTIVGDELSYNEALELGGLDYPLHLRPLTVTSPIMDAAGTEIDSLELPVPDQFAVVRSDRHEVLGVVGSRYRVVDNRNATQVVEALVGEGLARIETAGVLNKGADAWMALKFVGERLERAGENGGDQVDFYGLVRTNHNGQASLSVSTTPIRVVCANTLAMALADGQTTTHKVRHSGKAGEKIVQAAQELWGAIATDAESMSRAFTQLRRSSLSPAQFTKAVLDVVAPLPVLEKNASPRSKALHESRLYEVQTERRTLQRLWEQGTGQRGAMTAWDAFNAATEAIDHFGVANATRGALKGDKLSQLLPGAQLDAKKVAVWNALLAVTA